VKSRLNNEEGMSFTEFSYQVLQGYDFLHLFDHQGVTVQMGGSDQWGNITAGIDLIRKVRGKPSFGITFPLITRSDGQKFGKSESGAIWLAPEKLSPFEFYQYLIRVADADVIKLLKMLTFMDLQEIAAIEKSMEGESYVPNTAQKRLAEEVTRIVHGEEGLQKALKVTAVAAPGSETVLDVESLELIAKDMPSHEIALQDLLGMKLIDLLVRTGMQKSKGDARKLIKNGGVYLNNNAVSDENAAIDQSSLIGEKLVLLATGKKNKVLVRVR
jgi:tyrosyl-tRNA synthetase